jgi:lipid A disaccharide synthetase
MVTPCINDIKHFNVQLMHTTLKNVELLKHFKIKEATPTCFGLQGNHHQGSNSQYLAKITHLVQCGYIEVVQMYVCTTSIYPHSTKCVILAKYWLLAP